MHKLFLFLLLPAVLGACAAIQPKSPELVVAERAQQRVDALMVRDYEGAYAYTTPGYRTTEGIIKYTSRWAGSGNWVSASVIEVRCDDGELVQKCQAFVEIIYDDPRFDPFPTTLGEDWLLIDGKWYLYQNIGE